MKRETRLNLWFLIIFIAISLPGAVILFRKKLKPNARPIFMTDEVERRLPYMAPEPTPPGFKRVVPPQTSAFIEDVAKERGGDVQLLFEIGPQGQRLPILSPDRQLQAVALRRVGEINLLDLVQWGRSTNSGSFDGAKLRVDHENEIEAKVQPIVQIALPEPIFRELMTFGYIAPPRQIEWIELEIPPMDVRQIRQITLKGQDGARQVNETVILPPRLDTLSSKLSS